MMLALMWALAQMPVAQAYRVGVVTIPSPQAQQGVSGQEAGQLSQRLVRRLGEIVGSEGVVIAPHEFLADGTQASRAHIEKLVTDLRIDSADEQAVFRLSQLVDDLASRSRLGPFLQVAALRLAIHHGKGSQELPSWVEVALKLHPRLEITQSQEWDQGADYPEIGFQITAQRARLKKECELNINELPSNSRITLNGFVWRAGAKLLHPGPFWMRVEGIQGVFERWVGCSSDPLKAQFVPVEVAPSRTLDVMERLRLDRLIVALASNRVQFFEVLRSGAVRRLHSSDKILKEVVDIAAQRLPFETMVESVPPMVAAKTQVAQSVVVVDPPEVAPRWYNQKTLWMGLGGLALGTYAVRALGVLERHPVVSVSGTIE